MPGPVLGSKVVNMTEQSLPLKGCGGVQARW